MSKTQVGGLMETKIRGDCFQLVIWVLSVGMYFVSLQYSTLTLDGKSLLHKMG